MTDQLKPEDRALIERLEKAEAGSRVIDADMALAIDPKFAGWIKHPNLKDDSPAWMQGELWPSREEFDDWLIRDGKPCSDYAPLYTTSLDAILALIGEKVGGGYRVDASGGSVDAWIWRKGTSRGGIYGEAWTAPLALCIALLRALKEKETGNGE